MRDLSVWHRVCWVLVFIRHTPMMGLFLYVVHVRLRGTGDDGRLGPDRSPDPPRASPLCIGCSVVNAGQGGRVVDGALWGWPGCTAGAPRRQLMQHQQQLEIEAHRRAGARMEELISPDES